MKEKCSKNGTTEESIAQAKIGFKTKIITKLLDERLVPVYFANFVWIMDWSIGCPAHDQRDLDFALKYNLKVITVVKLQMRMKILVKEIAYTDRFYFNSKF